ncbi:hypothetical protein M436DRAFT_49176 [Aureobasidium namibiae CBS 147.97]|uniref:Uncharacterized protein n=1 Tax=Aureobasidium namibiae CBS 147.97 TaxID=1043004 RepID=A0A074WR87_9PEZI
MPRSMAPPPSGEFLVRLQKPFNGTPTHTVDITGEPNRSANIKQTHHHGNTIEEKVGTMASDDVQELMRLISQLRGFPSHETKDVYGLDQVLELHTLEINWCNQESDPAANEISDISSETKQTFKDVVDSISAAARQFAKADNPL